MNDLFDASLISTTFTMLLMIAAFIFPLWPLIIVRVLVDGGRWYKAMLLMWVFLAILRFSLLFSPQPMPTFISLISEPLNTILFFVTGAGLLAINAGIWYKEKRKFTKRTGAIRREEDLQDLTPVEFENMVTELYKRLGHKARRTGKSGDHGVDVVVEAKNGERWVVQCKRWRGKVGEPQVRDFYGTMQHEKAEQGAIITTGGFSRPAKEWARGKPILLYDGAAFLKAWKKSERLQH